MDSIDVQDVPARPHTLADLAFTSAPGEAPKMTPYGCLVMADGTIHTLIEQFTHGMVLSLLFPEQAAAAGYGPPDEDSSVLRYQEFELDHKAVLPVVRISIGGLLGSTNISKGDEPATPAQIQAVAAYAHACGLKLSNKVHLECGECSLRQALKWLALDADSIDHARWG